jgi:hypothetical protein
VIDKQLLEYDWEDLDVLADADSSSECRRTTSAADVTLSDILDSADNSTLLGPDRDRAIRTIP